MNMAGSERGHRLRAITPSSGREMNRITDGTYKRPVSAGEDVGGVTVLGAAVEHVGEEGLLGARGHCSPNTCR
jgi:hypothetical protein